MQKRLQRISVLSMAIVLLASAAASAAGDGFKPLFNGKNLKGWQGDKELWSVKDGTIVGTTHPRKIKHNTFLSTKKSYGDFVLRLKVKLENHNSGIQFRSEQRPDHVVIGYQADVAEQTYYGMLYEEGKRGFMPYWETLSQEKKDAIQAIVKKGDWNQYEITCKGDHITMVLNGKTTVDIEDPHGAKDGVIALQLHAGDPMRVQFKDLEIKELKN